jgi:hypothetical protein
MRIVVVRKGPGSICNVVVSLLEYPSSMLVLAVVRGGYPWRVAILVMQY